MEQAGLYNDIPERAAAPLGYGVQFQQPTVAPGAKIYRTEPMNRAYSPLNPQQAPWGVHNVWEAYRALYTSNKIKTIVFSIIATVVVAGILTVATLSGGILGGVLVFVLALVPLSIIVLCLEWVGKWDPEAFRMKLGIFLWGAAGSIIFTLLVGNSLITVFPFLADPVLGATFQAPIVEELFKGLGLFVIVMFFHKHINSTVDAIVYMSLSAAGFAFTENILYFLQALFSEGGIIGLGMTFIMRGVLSPFAHVMFSLPMALTLGYVVSRRSKPKLGKTILFFLAGYIPAMFLHALWNGSASLLSGDMWFVFYAIVELPLFIIAVIVVIWVRKRDVMNTYKWVNHYANLGVISIPDVEVFGSWLGRKQTRQWAASKPGEVKFVSEKINKEIVDLARVRQLMETDQTEGLYAEEARLIASIRADKQLLMSTP